MSLGLSVKGAIDKGSLIPHFGEDGVPTGNAMSSRLRGVLAEVFPASSRLSSHSLKATGLTWAASAGVALDTRRLLAHHVHDSARSTETSAETFSRRRRVFSRKFSSPSVMATLRLTTLAGVKLGLDSGSCLQQTRPGRAGGSPASGFKCSSRPRQRVVSGCVSRATGT